MNPSQKRQRRITRHKRVRAKIRGTSARPRLSVFRSNRHIHLQLIDDDKGVTIAAASTRDVKGKAPAGEKIREAAKALAKAAAAAGVKQAVFDRGGFVYHGNIKLAAETVREQGVKI